MGDQAEMNALLVETGLAGVSRISDPEQELYRAYGLERGRLGQLLGPKVLWRALAEGALAEHGLGKVSADAAQMPGVFLISDGKVVRRFRHRTAADLPTTQVLPHHSRGGSVTTTARAPVLPTPR